MIDNIRRTIYIHIEELKDETTKDLCRKIKSRISKTLVKYFLSYQSMFCMPYGNSNKMNESFDCFDSYL